MKNCLRLASIVAWAAALCVCAATAAGAQVLAVTMNRSVVDALSQGYGIFPYDRPGVIATGIAGIVIWGGTLIMLGRFTSSSTH